MKVISSFVDLNTVYGSGKQGEALRRKLSNIKEVAQEYETREDKRTLVIILFCPCCNCSLPEHERLSNIELLRMQNAVLVSPFHDIDRSGFHIHVVDRAPEDSGYIEAFRTTIEKALA